MSEQMKPCECGGETQVYKSTHGFMPECMDCRLTINIHFPTEQAAIKSWNRRTAEPRAEKGRGVDENL